MEERRRVLLVEDDEATANYIERILGRYGLEVRRAGDAGKALELLSEILSSVSAVVLDVTLPYGKAREDLGGASDPEQIDTGIRILERLRGTPSGRDLWVAVVTARAHPYALQRIEELLGARGRLHRKPFDGFRFEHETALALHLESKVPACFLQEAETDEEAG